MSRANEFAFPAIGLEMESSGAVRLPVAHQGLTIREHFAAMAMQGLLASTQTDEMERAECARLSVLMADALIAELDCTSADKFTTLALAVRALLPEIDSEIDQRKTGGNDEDWLGLQRLVDNVREVLP